MTGPESEGQVREIENMIRRIRDVISARVMLGSDGKITEVHVLASGSRAAKQLVRDVESALMTQGHPIDHKKISVAQISQEDEDGALDRLQLAGLTTTISGRSFESRVRLQLRGATFEGTATAPATSNGRLRSLAEATLRAAGQCLPQEVQMHLEGCGLTAIGHRQAASVVVTELDSNGERSLLGSCLVRQDEADAIVRATLDAINRRISLFQAHLTV